MLVSQDRLDGNVSNGAVLTLLLGRQITQAERT